MLCSYRCGSRIKKLKEVLIKYFPGLLLLFLIALFSVFISRYLPKYIGRVFIAVLLGIIISNVAKPDRKVFGEGIKLGLGKFLKLAIVLLGVGISFKEIAKIGGGGILVIISLILLVFSSTYIMGRKLGVAMKKILLIAAGISICGNTAVVATAPIVKAEEEEVAMAVGIVTLFGVLGVLLYPMIGIAFGMQDLLFGTWAGTAINDTSQVVAAGFIFSEEAGRIATTIKLTRNIMLVPVVVLIAYFYNRKIKDEVKEKADIRKIFPMFVLGFLAVVFLNSFGFISGQVRNILTETSKFLILLALSGIGLGVDFRKLKKIGVKPFILGFTIQIILAVAALFLNSLVFGIKI